MRVTIIPEENRISVEGQSETVDCSTLYAEGVHVIQWYGSEGEIEYFNERGSTLKGNVSITDFSPYQALVDAWTVEAKKPLGAKKPLVAPKATEVTAVAS